MTRLTYQFHLSTKCGSWVWRCLLFASLSGTQVIAFTKGNSHGDPKTISKSHAHNVSSCSFTWLCSLYSASCTLRDIASTRPKLGVAPELAKVECTNSCDTGWHWAKPFGIDCRLYSARLQLKCPQNPANTSNLGGTNASALLNE